ncbi:MAG: AFG1/ZapE family ATPase, partial [Steroidobacteraceae bacterium]
MPAATPLMDRCQALLGAQGQTLDDAQRQVLVRLEDLRRRLIARQSGGSLIKKGLRLLPGARRAPLRGLWLWGGVGRGKTFLADQFYAELPFREKRREHFHRLMQDVHAGLRRHSRLPTPLKHVAEEIALEARILCFDEFAVSDV